MLICESFSAELFGEAASFLLDDVYTRISDLQSNAQMFGAGLYYHHVCLSACIQIQKRVISVKESGPIRVTKKKTVERYINFIRNVIESGSGISLNDIRDINGKETIFITNSEVKTYLTETFGSEIQFTLSEQKYKSHMVFSSWYFY